MRISNLFKRSLGASLLLCALGLGGVALAQTNGSAPSSGGQQRQENKPTLIAPQEHREGRAIGRTDLFCGGFLQYPTATDAPQIIGAEQEQEQNVFSQGDFVYVSAGSEQGVKEGQEFSVIRPRGNFTSPFTKKKGKLGIFTQELGQLRVVSVRPRVSVAVVKSSCDPMLFGDMIVPVPPRVAPVERPIANLDRFAAPSGKQTGRIVLARDYREMLQRDEIVYVDLGREDQIKTGDYLTVFRPVGTGKITHFRDDDIVPNENGGFQSYRFKGGKFSSQAKRAEDPNLSGLDNRSVTGPEIKSHRPPLPRKVVGELLILGVQERTATAIVTRAAQEIHTGDFVELQ